MGFVKTGLGTSLGVVEPPKSVPAKPEPKQVEVPKQAEQVKQAQEPKAR